MGRPRKKVKLPVVKKAEGKPDILGPEIVLTKPGYTMEIRAWCGRYKDWCQNKINKADCECSQKRDGCMFARFGLYVVFH